MSMRYLSALRSDCKKFCFEHLSAAGGFRFKKFEFISDFVLRISSLTLYMARTYEKNVASRLMHLDILWSTLDILWSIVGVLWSAFG